MDYLNTHIGREYGQAHTLTFEAGLMIQLNQKLYIGTQVFNPVRIGIGKIQEPLMTTFRLGGGYFISNQILLCLEAEKDIEQPLITRFGTEYTPFDSFSFRAGIAVNPVMNYFGLGYQWKSFQADLAFSYHNLLGYIPDFSLSYEF